MEIFTRLWPLQPCGLVLYSLRRNLERMEQPNCDAKTERRAVGEEGPFKYSADSAASWATNRPARDRSCCYYEDRYHLALLGAHRFTNHRWAKVGS